MLDTMQAANGGEKSLISDPAAATPTNVGANQLPGIP